MTTLLRYSTLAATVVVLLLVTAGDAAAQRTRDSLSILETPSGTYITCFDISVTNRQNDTSIRISDFRMRIISGRAQFMGGLTGSPAYWSVLSQTSSAVRWTSNAAIGDIRSHITTSGFRICVADTGVFRMVWETHSLDSLISSDTIVFAGRRGGCDEVFARLQPSLTRAIVDMDVVASNGSGFAVNDIRFHPITPGVQFSTADVPLPSGWVRLRLKPDTIGFFTNTRALDFGRFVEGLRLVLTGTHPDSTVRIEWMTMNYGELICRDTLTMTFGLKRRDSLLRIGALTPTQRGCCINLALLNRHEPATPIDKVTMKLTTPGSRIDSLPRLPAGWTMTAAADSLVLTVPANGFMPGDSAFLGNLCVDNTGAANDSIRMQWYTYVNGVDVTPIAMSVYCMRPLTSCDSISAIVDSTYPSVSRCIGLTVRNRNSRRDPVKGLTLRISNPGVPRRVLSATAPAPWRVAAAGGDSVVFTSGTISAGATVGGFSICTTIGDSATHDPLSITWTTIHTPGPSCTDVLPVNAVVNVECDSLVARQVSSPDTNLRCFVARIRNRNARGRALDRLHLEVAPTQRVIFADASAALPWQVRTSAFPSFDVDYGGDAIHAGEESPDLMFCLDVRQLPAQMLTVPLVWRSYSGDSLVCLDTLRLRMSPSTFVECDSVSKQTVIHADTCLVIVRLRNTHVPAGPINSARFIARFGSVASHSMIRDINVGGANTHEWVVSERTDTSVTISGEWLEAHETLDSIMLSLFAGGDIAGTLECCTFADGIPICCSEHETGCATGHVVIDGRPTGFTFLDAAPNPATQSVTVRFFVGRAADVVVSLIDQHGAVVRELDRGRREAGIDAAVIDLAGIPSGTYYCSVTVGGERDTRKIVVVR